MDIFKSNPGRIFPFVIDGCSRLEDGKSCWLRTQIPANRSIMSVPVGPNGHVGVSTTSTSVTFTVLEWGYFDGPGSKISFITTQNDDGTVSLTQQGVAQFASIAMSIAINEGHASELPWKIQSENLQCVAGVGAFCGNW